MAKEVVDIEALINYEDLPAVTDDELRVAAVQYQGEHERSRGLIRLLGTGRGEGSICIHKGCGQGNYGREHASPGFRHRRGNAVWAI